MMAFNPPDMSFTPHLKSANEAVAMIGGLHVALQKAAILKAEEIAAVAAADREERHRLFDEYTESIVKATKNLVGEGASISDEANGIGAALKLIEIVFAGIRGLL